VTARALAFLLAAVLRASAAHGEPAAAPMADCAAILARSSSEWVETCASRGDDSPDAIEAALARYGECYDAATERAAERLREVDPAAADEVAACLPALRASLEGFSEYALGAALNRGTYSRITTARAALYEKQLPRLAYEARGPRRDAATPPERPAAARARLREILDAAPPRLRRDLEERFEKLRSAAASCRISPAPTDELAIYLLQSPSDPPFAPPPF
jgi:hypothetical protein